LRLWTSRRGAIQPLNPERCNPGKRLQARVEVGPRRNLPALEPDERCKPERADLARIVDGKADARVAVGAAAADQRGEARRRRLRLDLGQVSGAAGKFILLPLPHDLSQLRARNLLQK
jgi:hypothetical protein